MAADQELEAKHKVRIHIDRTPYESPNPTTGAALYSLGNIPDGYELFREVQGENEDATVKRDGEEIHLKRDEHFYSERVFEIIVEGTPHEWAKGEISYAEVVTLEVPDYAQHPEITYSVKYKNGHGNRPEGTLSPGASVKVKEGMIFSVSETGQS
jgi:hypothetical protein